MGDREVRYSWEHEFEYDVEPRPIVRGGMGCMGSYAMLLIAVPIGLLLGSVIMLLAMFAPWVYPLAMVAYFVVRIRNAVMSYSRKQGRD